MAAIPPALIINLPRHDKRRATVEEAVRAAGLAFNWAAAVDGALLSATDRRQATTALGNAMMTPGMIGCFLSHRACWAECAKSNRPLLVLEDDAELASGFLESLKAALAELQERDPSFDVLLLGALGCVHPRLRYGANVLHGLMGGGWRWPRSLSPILHVPARPFGTHAYVVTPSGAEKLLRLCARANFHVDVSAWGQAELRLYLATDVGGRLLAKQALMGDTTIGGLADRSWLPRFTIDEYTGAEFSWAFNAPVLQLGGVVLTIGRSLLSTTLLVLLAATTHSASGWSLALLWLTVQFGLIQLLKVQRWYCWTTRQLAAALAVGVAALVWWLGLRGAADELSADVSSSARLLLGPSPLGHGGRIELERAQGPGTLPRLRVVGGRVFDEASLVSIYSFFDRVLLLRRPFTCLWDPRRVVWPKLSGRQMRMIRAWVDANAVQWDTRVQAHALLLTNPVVRSIANLVMRLFAPPQPTAIVPSEAEALAFARSCCRRPRSWVKASYADREQRFRLFGSTYGVGNVGGVGGALDARAMRWGACRIAWPEISSWVVAFGAHLLLLGLFGAPVALVLHRAPPRWRVHVGMLCGLTLVLAIPVAVHLGRQHLPGGLSWMGAFLASTLGFNGFFKCLAFAFDATPPGAQAAWRPWLLWFTSLPEPIFHNGQLQRPSAADGRWRAALLALKLTCLGALLSVLHAAQPAAASGDALPAAASGSAWPVAAAPAPAPSSHSLPVAMAHLWVIYLWASSCLDISTLLVMLSGATTEPGFGNPLLASRSLREAWGERWNRPVHVLLKRAVYVPARRRAIPAPLAALLTFIASGALHEYNFAIHNAAAYEPGHAMAFFLLMGILMLLEAAVQDAALKRTPKRLRALLGATPSAVISVGLQLAVLPAFAPLFMRSWLESGMIEAVGAMVPRVQC